jgi:anti-anti-sigma regulatory factor
MTAVAYRLPVQSTPIRIALEEPGLLVVTGDLDDLAVPALRSALETHGGAAELTVDLGDASYVCSQAVSVLVGATRGAHAMGRTLRLTAPTGSIAERVLAVLGIPHDAT